MSNRIALMVRGLPSIGIDEAIERFGKYYNSPNPTVFHSSESFPQALVDDYGDITFIDKEGGVQGGGGLTKESMRDLRRLKSDFENYIYENPNIYTNQPTTESRAKLYKHIGFKGDDYQALDARRIAEEDLPYTRALDSKLLPSNVLEALGLNKSATGFIKLENGRVRSLERFRRPLLLDILAQGSSPSKLNSLDALTNYAARKLGGKYNGDYSFRVR